MAGSNDCFDYFDQVGPTGPKWLNTWYFQHPQTYFYYGPYSLYLMVLGVSERVVGGAVRVSILGNRNYGFG